LISVDSRSEPLLQSFAVIAKPGDSLVVCSVECLQTALKLGQKAIFDNMRHRLLLAAVTQRVVSLTPGVEVGCTQTLAGTEPGQQGP
jgi:hypothetical protein